MSIRKELSGYTLIALNYHLLPSCSLLNVVVMFAAHICGVKVVKYSSSEMSSVRSQSSDIYQSLIVVPKLLAHRFVLIDSCF